MNNHDNQSKDGKPKDGKPTVKDQDGDTPKKKAKIPFNPKFFLRKIIEGMKIPKTTDYTYTDKDQK